MNDIINTISKKIEGVESMNAGQMREILIGINEGVDISIYAKPEFSAVQMKAIREGMQKSQDITKYAGKYNSLQVAQINSGLEKGLDVSIYTNPEYSAPKMRLLYDALVYGVPTSDVKRIAIPAYNAGQLRAIVRGLKHGLDTTVYEDTNLQVYAMADKFRELLKEKRN